MPLALGGAIPPALALLLFSPVGASRPALLTEADANRLTKLSTSHIPKCVPVIGTDQDLQDCSAICRHAIKDIPQPVFPLHFFGGLDAEDRSKVRTGADMIEAIGGCQGDGAESCLSISGVKMAKDQQYISLSDVGEDSSNFVFPVHVNAYFTCYTRDKLPLFTSWLVDPDLQPKGDSRTKRVGSFGNLPKTNPQRDMYHNKLQDEYLRSGDVRGVWADYFGFDQGHWAPDAPFREEKQLVATTYYYINVSPQTACLNRGNWEGLESRVRATAVELDESIQVMAGPLRAVPSTFFETGEQRSQWADLLDVWRVAGEVLMEGQVAKKDPHWIEVTWQTDGGAPRQCILRGKEANAARDGAFPDLADVKACNVPHLQRASLLGRISVFLMTEAGAKRVRRGVRVPLAYFKVVTLPRNKYCCWLMDQLDQVSPIKGEECLNTVATHSWNHAPGDLHILSTEASYAGDATCSSLFTPSQTSSTVNCGFKNTGIGWRGQYLLREAGVEF